MTRLIKNWTITVAVAGLLTACGGADKAETPENMDAGDINALMQQQVDRAEDVKIRDKKSLTQSGRIANDYIQGMDEVATALGSVNDEASAKKAAETMAKIGKEFDKLAEDFEDGGASREEVMVAVMMSRQQELMAVQQRIAGNMMRIQTQNPELMPIISEAMASVNN